MLLYVLLFNQYTQTCYYTVYLFRITMHVHTHEQNSCPGFDGIKIKYYY